MRGETRRKGYLTKQLDKVLTLIALAEKQDREGYLHFHSPYSSSYHHPDMPSMLQAVAYHSC